MDACQTKVVSFIRNVFKMRVKYLNKFIGEIKKNSFSDIGQDQFKLIVC